MTQACFIRDVLAHPSEDMFIGIDPGRRGAMVILCDATRALPESMAYRFSKEDLYLTGALKAYHNAASCLARAKRYTAVERVQAPPGNAHQFEQGCNYGMACALAELINADSTFMLTPQMWQKQLGVRGMSEEYNQRKKLFRTVAKEVAPWILAEEADAFLIAIALKAKVLKLSI